MNAEKRENNESASSDIEGCGDSGAEETGAATATIPKKRGRPAKAIKVVNKSSGRGRGRPPKNGGGAGAGAGVVGGDASPTELANGSKRVSVGRGRPPKLGKPKISHSIVATGKGRGRPKAAKRAADADDDDADEEELIDSRLDKKVGKSGQSSTKRSPGRPRKVVVPSEDDEDVSDDDKDDDDERRTVGRPSTGAVNLNIVRTGRGQGRPKKTVATSKKRVAEGSPEGSPKKRGRPANVKPSLAGTGSGRGRPKSKRASSPEEEDEDSKEDSEIDEKEDEDEEPYKSPIKVDDAESGDSDDEEFTTVGKKHRELTADQLAAA